MVRFADQHEGIAALTQRDDYIRQLSPFDRQVRLRTSRPVSEQEFLGFIAGHVRPWTDAEVARLTPMFEQLGEKLRPWKLPLPPVILLVKTSGEEEGRAAYCRGSAIVLPQNMLDQQPSRLPKILPHEVFHVLSSHNLELRKRLYATIGFHPTGDVQLPEPLRPRKITNPDAPLNNFAISTDSPGGPLEWMPVLISKSERYDPARGGLLFDYLDFKLMQLERDGGMRRPALRNGQAVLVEPASVPGYAEQIGANTKYIIHPEEVLADNFVFLLEGRIDLPTPRIVEAMGNVLQGEPRGEKGDGSH
ncbi:MAG: hypothetical protein WD845_06845 [Pirellulales bacterium]